MEFNTCGHCGAGDGRAGMLIGCEGEDVSLCLNCHDTKRDGCVVIHANLRRTAEELSKTMALLNVG